MSPKLHQVDAVLFDRTGRGVALNAVGARALPEFTAAFDGLANAVQILRAEAAPKVVKMEARA